MSELVHLDVAAGVATITLDSQANRNALSAQLRRELLGHLETAIADDAARVVVLGHTGRVFCSGMDLKEARGAGAADNDPPGSTEIAHPNDRHQEAGGTGTYADPLSLAADPRAIPVGTRVYYPPLRKYFVMEDDCAQCITDWRSSRRPHIDLWTGDFQGSALLACENALTPDGLVAVEVNPPPGRPVDPRPLFNGRGCTT